MTETTNTLQADDELPLLPCPFCGYKHPTISVRENENGKFFGVTCGNCGVVHDLHEKMSFAVDAWNMRTENTEALQSAFNAGAEAMRRDAYALATGYGALKHGHLSLDPRVVLLESSAEIGAAIKCLPHPDYVKTYPRSARPLGANGEHLCVQNSEATPAEDKK